MGKRRFVSALAVLAALLLCAGCAGEQSPGGSSPAPAPPAAEGDHPIELTEASKEAYAQLLWPLAESGALVNSWSGSVPDETAYPEQYGVPKMLEVVDAQVVEDTMILGAEVYGVVLVNPQTGEEHITNGDWVVADTFWVQSPASDPHHPYVLLGTAKVTVQSTAAGHEIRSCDWQPVEKPGRTSLEAQNQKAAAEIAASERLDLSRYDPRMVDCVYQTVRSQRLISGPEELTLWDLENLCTQLELYGAGESDPETGEYTPDPLPLDAGLLRLIPSLRSCTIGHPLADYSVFEEMDLDTLTIYTENETIPLDFSTLRIGHAKLLSISGFNQDIALDLSHANVDSLYIHSWSAAVTDFRGGEGVKELEFRNTRSDTSILNANSFPDLEVLRLDFYSEYPRFRDLSQLATFGEKVQIDLTLSYQACNNKTVASLDGVRLNRLVLDPSGQWPLNEPDPALVERVNASQVEWLTR